MLAALRPEGGHQSTAQILGLFESIISNPAMPRNYTNAGMPSSGTAGTFAGIADPGSVCYDTTHENFYFNEGTKASPYWTPTNFNQKNLHCVNEDFRDNVGTAVGGSDMSVIKAGSGLRIFGDGHADNDSGLVVQAAAEGGIQARMTTTDEAAHGLALGMDAGVWQPDITGGMVIDVEFSNVSAITNRSMFIGFVGTAIDAFVAGVTGATTVVTLVQDDIAGAHFSTGYADGNAWYSIANKSDADASETADIDTETDVPAAATYQRMRVEIDASGGMTIFANKTLIDTTAEALDADEECSPIFFLESLSNAIISADVRSISMWSARPSVA